MNTIAHIVFAGLLSGIAAGNARSGDVNTPAARILDVRYVDHPGYSRLEIKLRGNPSYSTTRRDNVFRIVFAATDIIPARDGARIPLTTGFVKRLCLDRSADSAVVAVSCKPHSAVHVGRMNNKTGVCLDISRDTSTASGQDSLSADPAPPDVSHQVIVPIQVFSVKSLVAEKLPDSSGGRGDSMLSRDLATAHTLPLMEFLRPLDLHLMPVLLTIGASILSTGLVLLLIRRRYEGRKRTKSFSREYQAQYPGTSEAPQSLPEEPESPHSREPMTPPSTQGVSMLGLARKYGRGVGEINLSFALRSRQGEQRWARTVHEVNRVGESPENKKRVARELGVGRGEVDLAMVFHHFKSPRTLGKELA